MTVAQYRDYKNQVEKDFKILFDNSTKQEEKNAILLQSLKTIVDSKLDLPLGDNVNIGSYQLVQYATLINVLGKKNLPATQESAKKKSSLITTTNKSA